MDEGDLPGSGPLPEFGFGSEADLDAYGAWLEREIAAGRERVPGPWELEGPAVSVSLGDAADLDPALLAAMCGPDGLGGQSPGAAFGQGGAADVLRPGPVLAALAEQAAADVAELSGDELIGVLRAARRLENRAACQQLAVIAEFARRCAAARQEAAARGVPAGRRRGEFPYEELAVELVTTQGDADAQVSLALDLAGRLPRTGQGMAAGVIDRDRASAIAYYTRSLTAADAARADEVLAAAAPGLRPDQLARRAAALEMKLAPEAVRARREHARQARQRVEVRREYSGNAALSGRELGTAEALAAKANIDALAARLRAGGLDGTLDQLRALVLTDLTQSRDPLARITPAAPASPASPATAGPAATAGPGAPGEPPAGPGSPAGPAAGQAGHAAGSAAAAAGGVAPLPALINLLVPAGLLFGWPASPAQAGGWGLLDADETRDIVRAASLDPRTRWCLTITGRDGTAIAHGCAPGQHPWDPLEHGEHGEHGEPPGSRRREGDPGSPGGPPGGEAPTTAQAARLAGFLRRLNITPEPIARGECGHPHAEDRYTPGRWLAHLIRARTATCTAPGCNAQAAHCDLDHTLAYPAGLTCQCNLGPLCRRHHRAKQAPGWNLQQPEPGVFRWTTPSGRAHTTTPTAYDPAQ